MAINLKQISSSDSDNTKLDKVNYNFDQLIMNGGGPMGHQGIRGTQGPQGVTGPQGSQGAIGSQGDQGSAGLTNNQLWTSIAGNISSLTADTILPIHSATTSTVYPPVISVGFLDSDPEYTTAQSISGGNVPYQWLINRKSNFSSNLRFTNDQPTSYFDFTMTTVAGTNANMTMGFNSASNGVIEWHAEKHLFVDNVSRNTILEINSSTIIYNSPIEFRNDVHILDTLSINHSSAQAGRLAYAANSAGEINFASALQIGGGVPYGTIISILPSIFTAPAFFENTQSIDASTGLAQVEPLKFIVGRGVIGSPWQGWYLCNGQTWLDPAVGGSSGIGHNVPDLNSFSYDIQDNTSISQPTPGYLSSQGNEVWNVSERHLMGGTEADMIATQPTTQGIYDVQGSVTSTTSPFTGASSGTPVFIIKQLPQVIYLGFPDLYWEQQGTPV